MTGFDPPTRRTEALEETKLTYWVPSLRRGRVAHCFAARDLGLKHIEAGFFEFGIRRGGNRRTQWRRISTHLSKDDLHKLNSFRRAGNQEDSGGRMELQPQGSSAVRRVEFPRGANGSDDIIDGLF